MKRKEFFKILGKEGHDRLRIRLEIDKGELTSLVVQQDIKDKWEHYKKKYLKGKKK